MQCWKCGTEILDYPENKLPFRALCDKCSAWLHCCRNCLNYKPGMPNDCLVPGTEFIRDREAANFCEEFQLLGKAPPKKPDIKEIQKKLFKDDSDLPPEQNPKSKFNNLFND